ncbi:MAG: acyl-CoA dehydrogenase family protein [Myxococcota bacterium]
MDFRDSPSEAAFRAEATAFLAEHAPERFRSYTTEGADMEEVFQEHVVWQKKLAAHGWGALTWPKEFGGRGLGPIEQIIWNEELTRLGGAHSMLAVGIGMAGPTLIAHGTDAQKERYLAKLLYADEVWCQLFSEPGAGSDLASLATRAVRDGDEWIVNGQKTWCSGAQHADFGILIARTDPKAPKHQGITYFLLDMKLPGIEVRPLVEMTGEARFNEVFLSDVSLPDSARLGEVGQGWSITQTTLLNERMAMAGLSSLLDFDALRALVKERLDEIRGDDGERALLREETARVYSELKSLELLNARVVTKLGRGQIPSAESSVMKLALARVMTRAAEAAMKAMGPGALLRRGFWQNEFLFAPAWHIAGGTDQVQKNVCAERVLGMPRDLHDTKDIPFDQLPRS